MTGTIVYTPEQPHECQPWKTNIERLPGRVWVCQCGRYWVIDRHGMWQWETARQRRKRLRRTTGETKNSNDI